MTHLYTMFSSYRKQSVDLFFQLSDLLPYDGNIVHKCLKITSANILWYRSTNAIYIWFIIEVALSPFPNKITNVFFHSRGWFWKSVLKSVIYIFIVIHFKQGLNIVSYCLTLLKWFWKRNITRVEITAGYQQKLTEDLLWSVRETFFTIKKSSRMY